MILTGKAKEDFGDVCKYDYHEFIKLNEVVQYAIIIEWFDSLVIYINIVPSIAIGYENVDFFYFTINNDTNRLKFNSRQEATKQAIEKANEIYNERV